MNMQEKKGCLDCGKEIVGGVDKKLSLIAVTNKLIKQAFAIAKNGVRYNS